jgi:hypothetical protein
MRTRDEGRIVYYLCRTGGPPPAEVVCTDTSDPASQGAGFFACDRGAPACREPLTSYGRSRIKGRQRSSPGQPRKSPGSLAVLLIQDEINRPAELGRVNGPVIGDVRKG